MIDIPDINRSTLFVIISVLGFVGALSLLAAKALGFVQPSLKLYVGAGAVWFAVLLGAVFYGGGE